MVYKKKVGAMKKRVYRRKARVPSTKKATFAKRVKTVISRMAENKNANFRGSINLYAYGATNWANTITPCTPDTLYLTIQQGVGQGDRVGNSVRVKSLKMTGVLRTALYNVTANPIPLPCYVKFLFLTRKDTPTNIYGTLDDVLQYGSTAESIGNSTALRNMYRPVNTDNWTYHTTRIYKLGYASATGTGSVPVAEYFANNDFKLNHFVNIDLTKFCTKIIKWNDNITDPSTRNIVMYPMLYASDGSNIANASLASFDYSLDMVYEDM